MYSGWWICNVDGQMGWGPPSYLKKCCGVVEDEESDRSEDEAADLKGRECIKRCVNSYLVIYPKLFD